MRGLLKTLSPFAPDQSGAVSVLYEMGGILVICDAGGCAGNICGFDEPRWFTRKSAVFSAGLRDMDAILGRDDQLIEKLKAAAEVTGGAFAAVIGTPVPAVIGTDYRALERMGERRTGLPVLALETQGTALYDEGAEKAWYRLFERFAAERCPVQAGTVGVLGATPLSVSRLDAADRIRAVLEEQGAGRVTVYGMGDGLEAVRKASSAERNVVVAPEAVPAAELLKERFGTPYETGYPALPDPGRDALTGKKILIVHQQILANALRERIEKENPSAEVTVASWFMLRPELCREGDFTLEEEEQFAEAVRKGGYDRVIGDADFRRTLRGYRGAFTDLPHFAVSGRMQQD